MAMSGYWAAGCCSTKQVSFKCGQPPTEQSHELIAPEQPKASDNHISQSLQRKLTDRGVPFYYFTERQTATFAERFDDFLKEYEKRYGEPLIVLLDNRIARRIVDFPGEKRHPDQTIDFVPDMTVPFLFKTLSSICVEEWKITYMVHSA